MLARAVSEGLDQGQEQPLRRISAEAGGADPALERKNLYEQSHDLRALANLVNFLEEQESWQELLHYAEELFRRTRALEDGARVAKVLDTSEQYGALFAFLSTHQDLVEQLPGLKTRWSWALYRDGRVVDASAVLKALAANRDDANDRALRVRIAISSGDWGDLIAYTNSEWSNQAERSASELLTAGQLANAVGGIHAADLVIAVHAGTRRSQAGVGQASVLGLGAIERRRHPGLRRCSCLESQHARSCPAPVAR